MPAPVSELVRRLWVGLKKLTHEYRYQSGTGSGAITYTFHAPKGVSEEPPSIQTVRFFLEYFMPELLRVKVSSPARWTQLRSYWLGNWKVAEYKVSDQIGIYEMTIFLPDSVTQNESARRSGKLLKEQIRASTEKPFFYIPVAQEIQDRLLSIAQDLDDVKLEDADHITLLYVPPGPDFDPELSRDVHGRVDAVGTSNKPFVAQLQGWAYFDNVRDLDGEPATALVALVDGPEIQDLHQQLRAAITPSGWDTAKRKHAFVPHITLAYLPAGDRAQPQGLPQLHMSQTVDHFNMAYDEIRTYRLDGVSQGLIDSVLRGQSPRAVLLGA